MTDRINIHIEATGQDTTAKLSCECVGVSNHHIAVLYGIPCLKYFPLFSEVRFSGKEELFYCDQQNGMLISKAVKPLDFWLGK